MRSPLKFIVIKMVATLYVPTNDITVTYKNGRTEYYYCGEWDLQLGIER